MLLVTPSFLGFPMKATCFGKRQDTQEAGNLDGTEKSFFPPVSSEGLGQASSHRACQIYPGRIGAILTAVLLLKLCH